MPKSFIVFAAVLLLYLRALPPSLVAWRDAGEMCTAAWTLGVAHPTSYPLYVLIGRAMRQIPLGNFAYRLNLLSAVAGALAVAGLFAWSRRRRGLAAALAATWLAFDPVFWTVSQVSEMYSLWAFGAVGLLILAHEASADASERLWPALCFLSGLCLGNRLDLLLWAPGLLWLALARRPGGESEDGVWAAAVFILFPALVAFSGSNAPMAAIVIGTLLWRSRGAGMSRRVLLAAAAGLSGLSVYLFLPVRSATGPFLDWNHPAVLSNFLDSLLRTRYGGTLDLISRNYAMGELFLDNLRLWGAHLWDAFGPAGLSAALLGAASGFSADRRRWLGRAACWWWSGPVFIFLANLPPNPHASAIIEPHYLLSDIVLVFWAMDGVGVLSAVSPRGLASVLVVISVAWPLWRGVPARMDRRHDFSLADYSSNALRAAPLGSIVVAKKDVQLYSLWYAQAVAGKRPDLGVVAQGLAGSPWYQSDWRRRDHALNIASLREPAGWSALASGGRTVLATHDADIPAPLTAATRSRGLLVALSPGDDDVPWELMVRRDRRRFGETPDFFASDLIESLAIASYRRGMDLQKSGRSPEARARLMEAWVRHWDFPDVPLMLGYMAAVSSDWAEASAEYALADALFAEKLRLAARYRSLPDLVSSIRRQAAESATHSGVAAERLGRPEEARSHYQRALSLFPLAQTRFNLAALAWGKDWGAVEENLSEALRLDPNHSEARKYLTALRVRGARR